MALVFLVCLGYTLQPIHNTNIKKKKKKQRAVLKVF